MSRWALRRFWFELPAVAAIASTSRISVSQAPMTTRAAHSQIAVPFRHRLRPQSRSETDRRSKHSAWGIGRIAHFIAIVGPSEGAGVTGRQFYNDFNSGCKAGKSSNRLPCPLPQFAEQKPSRRRSQPEHRLGLKAAEMVQTRDECEPPACGWSKSYCHAPATPLRPPENRVLSGRLFGRKATYGMRRSYCQDGRCRAHIPHDISANVSSPSAKDPPIVSEKEETDGPQLLRQHR